MLFLAFCSVIGLTYGITRYSTCRVATAALAACSTVIVALYAAGLFGVLPAAANVLCATGLACLIPAARKGRVLATTYRHDGRLVWLVAALCVPWIFLWWRSDFLFLNWDDISHWARVTSFLARENRLFDGSTTVIAAKGYPPGSALFHYFFLHVGGYSEPHVIFAHVLLTWAGLCAIVGPVAERREECAAISLGLLLVAMHLFRFTFEDISVDALLGVFFAAAVVIGLTERTARGVVVGTVPVLMALVLLKPTGVAFAMMAAGVCVAAVYLRPLRGAGADIVPFVVGTPIDRRHLLALLTLPVVAGLTYASWQSYAASIGALGGGPGLLSAVSSLMHGLWSHPMPDRLSQTLIEIRRRFFVGDVYAVPLFGVPGKWMLSPSMLALVLIGINAVLWALAPRGSRRPLGAILILMPLGCAVYLFLLVLAYLSYFTEYEGVRLASFERYLGSFFLAWIGITLASAAGLLVDRASRRVAVAVSVTVALIASTTVPSLARYLEAASQQKRDLLLPSKIQSDWLADVVRRVAHPRDKVYFVKQADTGFGMYAFQFAVQPFETQDSCWSLGPAYNTDDVWTCDAALEDKVRGYDILALAVADQKFWARFGALFDPADRGVAAGVFRIIWNGGSPRFVFIPS
ncbi:MAG: hypothetical protein ABI051_13500 [Vicinamibacterales bacterium]